MDQIMHISPVVVRQQVKDSGNTFEARNIGAEALLTVIADSPPSSKIRFAYAREAAFLAVPGSETHENALSSYKTYAERALRDEKPSRPIVETLTMDAVATRNDKALHSVIMDVLRADRAAAAALQNDQQRAAAQKLEGGRHLPQARSSRGAAARRFG